MVYIPHISRTFYVYCTWLTIDLYSTRVYAGCCLLDGTHRRALHMLLILDNQARFLIIVYGRNGGSWGSFGNPGICGNSGIGPNPGG
jgi:hypothetical protein